MARIKEIKAQRSQDYHEMRSKRLKDERDRATFKDMIVEENKKKHDIVIAEERRIARSLNRFEKTKKRHREGEYKIRVDR